MSHFKLLTFNVLCFYFDVNIWTVLAFMMCSKLLLLPIIYIIYLLITWKTKVIVCLSKEAQASSYSHNWFYGSHSETVWVISLAVTTPVEMKGHFVTSGSCWIKGHFKARGKSSEHVSTAHVNTHSAAFTGPLSLIMFFQCISEFNDLQWHNRLCKRGINSGRREPQMRSGCPLLFAALGWRVNVAPGTLASRWWWAYWEWHLR